MQKNNQYFKTVFVALWLCCMTAHASALPEKLLNAPIHLVTGEQVRLADYQAKQPVYLKFWATWCKPCIAQMPHFEHVQKEYGKEIKVIGINLGINDDLNSVKKAIKQYGLSMPMAIDESGDLAQDFHLIGTPYHLVFDKQMNLVHLGHEADADLDSALALVAQRKVSEIIDAKVLVENETDIALNVNDGKVHALLFTASWCDWYWQDTRPEASQNCIKAQKAVNAVYQQFPDYQWLGVINRLWTGDKDLAEYQQKFHVKHALAIDKSNRLFHQYGINQLPVLVLIKKGQVLKRITDFDQQDALLKLLQD